MPMQIRRTVTPNNPPSGLAEGQLSVEMASAPPKLWAGVPVGIDASGRVQISPPLDYVSTTALTTTLADFLPLAGDTMTGPLTLAGDATQPLEPVTLEQLEAELEPLRQSGGRNLLDNPWFAINQRAVAAATAGGMYPVDRWRVTLSGGDTIWAAQQNLTPAEIAGIGNEQAVWKLAVVATGTAGGGTFIRQVTEGVQRLSGKTVTMSFYAVTTTPGLRLGFAINQNFGTGGSAPVYGAAAVFTLTAAWTPYQVTLTVPSTIGQTVMADSSTSFVFVFSNDNEPSIGMQSGSFFLWGTQLEVGTKASPAEIPDPQRELSLCHRYYQASIRLIMQGYQQAGNSFQTSAMLPVQMRANPTVSMNQDNSQNLTNVSVTALQNVVWNNGTAIATGPTAVNLWFNLDAEIA